MDRSNLLREKMALSHLAQFAVGSDGQKRVEGWLGAGRFGLRTSDGEVVCLIIVAPGC